VFLVTLHGFWGNGSDLAPISEALRQANLVDRSWGPDLLVPGPLSPDLGFSEWTESFANELRRRAVGSKVMAIGYSMGGRLLLHVLKSHPELFRGAVIVSSQPQLQTVEEVRERKLWELNWDLAFQDRPWNELWRDWNHMEVLKSKSLRPPPMEFSHSREYLAKALKEWSPSRHLISVQDFRQIEVPLLWVAGQKDRKYAKMYSEFCQMGIQGQFEFVSDAGHRVHLDQPDLFTQVVSRFIRG
jgi:2-succinyl-6-hydroxy-2,4-cyclohexadiene-1-carboxylate synthase